MHSLIADSLVLAFTYGVSLRQWQDSGMLEREWALYRELLPCYHKLLLVTYGNKSDEEVLSTLLRRESDRRRIALICNDHNLPPAEYVTSLPFRVRAALAGCDSIVVKTNQMSGGDIAVRIVDALRKHGKHAALIARGGYLWTRFVAHERGPHSQPATE